MVAKNRLYYVNGMKALAVNPWNFDEDVGWINLTGASDPVAIQDIQDLFSRVPWLYRGVNLIAGAAKSVPYSLLDQAGEEYDEYTNWENKIICMPNPEMLLWLVTASLVLTGRAYLWIEKIGNRPRNLRYYAATDIQEIYSREDDTKLISINRRVGSEWRQHPVEDFIIFWLNDPNVTGKAPRGSPALAALSAAGVLWSSDTYAAKYFSSGAVKAFLLSLPVGTQKEERERMKTWLGRIANGIRSAWANYVMSDKVSTTTIGDGLDGLQNTELTKEKREDIATALGIPQSLLFSSAANFAVAEQDNEHFYTKNVIPLCGLVARTLNDQLFKRMGFRFEFQPQKMTMFQEDEEQRAKSLLELMQAVSAASSLEQFQFGLSVLGFDMSYEDMQLLVAHFAGKEERREEMADRLAGAQRPPAPEQPGQPLAQPTQEQPPQNGKEGKAVDLDKWRRKALKALKAGKPVTVEFESDEIPLALQGAIAGALEIARDASDVERIFEDAWLGYP